VRLAQPYRVNFTKPATPLNRRPVINLDALADLPDDHLPAALTEATALLTAIAGRLFASGGAVAPVDGLVDVTEASRLLGGVSADTLYESPTFKSARVRIGRRVLFDRAWLLAYIKRQGQR
jgi:hypothetical protein